MNGVLGMLELLSLTPLTREQRGTLAVVRESGRSLMRIIDDILDLSKIEAGKLELRPEAVDVAELVERARNVYAGNASSKGLTLRHVVDSRIGRSLLVDPLRLLQILNNLVSNAIKFTDKGEVTIWASLVEREAEREVVRFSVSDTGAGITEEDRGRLFAPFSQVSENPQARAGTGLGLSICQRLAAMMGSRIEVESEMGRGTTMTFTLALPVVNAAAPAEARESVRADDAARGRRPAPPVPEAEREGSLVLVVDDHPINRMVLVRQVNALGYAAEAAEDGMDALDMWATGRFAAIFTDCHMPELDGYGLARNIRACEQQNGHVRTPIIACTANVLGGEAERCLEAGMDDYLSKPVVLHQLAAKLDQWLPLRGASEQASDAPQPEPGPTCAVLDRGRLALVVGDDPRRQEEALGKFREFIREDVAALERTLAEGDPEAVAHAAHRIKGAARTFGAEELGLIAERFEDAARAGEVATARAGMVDLQGALARLEAEVGALAGGIAEECR